MLGNDPNMRGGDYLNFGYGVLYMLPRHLGRLNFENIIEHAFPQGQRLDPVQGLSLKLLTHVSPIWHFSLRSNNTINGEDDNRVFHWNGFRFLAANPWHCELCDTPSFLPQAPLRLVGEPLSLREPASNRLRLLNSIGLSGRPPLVFGVAPTDTGA